MTAATDLGLIAAKRWRSWQDKAVLQRTQAGMKQGQTLRREMNEESAPFSRGISQSGLDIEHELTGRKREESGESIGPYNCANRGLISITSDGRTVRRWSGAEMVKSLPSSDPFQRERTLLSPHAVSHTTRPEEGGQGPVVQRSSGDTWQSLSHERLSTDGATLVTGGDDDTIRFWNVATGREMLVFNNASSDVARLPHLSPTGELAVWQDAVQGRARVEFIPTMAEI